jgi:hypothetical protein
MVLLLVLKTSLDGSRNNKKNKDNKNNEKNKRNKIMKRLKRYPIPANNLVMIVVLLLISIFLLGCTPNNNTLTTPASNNLGSVVRIEVFHIHEVPECYSCKISGEYVNEAINLFFAEEIESGIISYKDIDKANLSNREIVSAHSVPAGWSGIYLGIYYENGFQSKEYTAMWNLENKEEFMHEFRDYIFKLLDTKTN